MILSKKSATFWDPVSGARSSAGEHSLHTGGVTGSIPVAPTIKSLIFQSLQNPHICSIGNSIRNGARTCAWEAWKIRGICSCVVPGHGLDAIPETGSLFCQLPGASLPRPPGCHARDVAPPRSPPPPKRRALMEAWGGVRDNKSGLAQATLRRAAEAMRREEEERRERYVAGITVV